MASFHRLRFRIAIWRGTLRNRKRLTEPPCASAFTAELGLFFQMPERSQVGNWLRFANRPLMGHPETRGDIWGHPATRRCGNPVGKLRESHRHGTSGDISRHAATSGDTPGWDRGEKRWEFFPTPTSASAAIRLSKNVIGQRRRRRLSPRRSVGGITGTHH